MPFGQLPAVCNHCQNARYWAKRPPNQLARCDRRRALHLKRRRLEARIRIVQDQLRDVLAELGELDAISRGNAPQ